MSASVITSTSAPTRISVMASSLFHGVPNQVRAPTSRSPPKAMSASSHRTNGERVAYLGSRSQRRRRVRHGRVTIIQITTALTTARDPIPLTRPRCHRSDRSRRGTRRTEPDSIGRSRFHQHRAPLTPVQGRDDEHGEKTHHGGDGTSRLTPSGAADVQRPMGLSSRPSQTWAASIATFSLMKACWVPV